MVTSIRITFSSSVPTDPPPTDSSQTNTEPIYNSTNDKNILDEIANQQAENIKQIIAVEQREQAGIMNYPGINKPVLQYNEPKKEQPLYIPQYNDPKKEQTLSLDKLSLEELKLKCSHLAALLNSNKTSTTTTPPPNKYINYKFHETSPRPVYIPRPSFRPIYSTTAKPNGFYITQNMKTPKPTLNVPPAAPIKYIRLEPVILQKTILSDGRTMYYWHKSLPTAVEYANSAVTQEVPNNQPPAYVAPPQYEAPPYKYGYNYNPYTSNKNVYGYPNNGYGMTNAYYIPTKNNGGSYANSYPYIEHAAPERNQHVEVTTNEPTTTTEATTYNGYGLGNFIPFYSFSRGSEASSTTTTTTPAPDHTSEITITAKPVAEKHPGEELLYAQQLKFVVPVPLEGASYRYQWGFDPYAYYPKELQPNSVNVQVPYTPTFHMIRAVQVPDNNNRRIDEVSVKKK